MFCKAFLKMPLSLSALEMTKAPCMLISVCVAFCVASSGVKPISSAKNLKLLSQLFIVVCINSPKDSIPVSVDNERKIQVFSP